jgi:hypothetical protein
MKSKRPLTPTALAAVLVQEFKIDRLRELRRLQIGGNNPTRVEVLQAELEALDVLEAAASIVQGRAA